MEDARGMPESEDVDSEVEEEHGARRPVTRRQPKEPTREEVEEHEVNHTPYRSWCPSCVAGRGKATPHTTTEDEEKAIPDIHVDYWFMRDERGSELVPVTNIKDGSSKTNKAHVVPGKGNVDGAADRIIKDIEDMGYTGSIILKSDQEPAIMDLVKEVKKKRKGATIIEAGKTKDSQSNGMIERGIQSVEGIVRTMKLSLEKKINKKIPCVHPVMSWLIEHGAETLNRYQVGRDGRTPYERLKGKAYKGEMIEFGRKVFTDTLERQMERRWEEGIWLGKRVVSDEHILASPSGKIMKARSIQLKPLSES